MEAAEAASPPAARPAASAQLQAVGTRGSSASRGKRATGCTNQGSDVFACNARIDPVGDHFTEPHPV